MVAGMIVAVFVQCAALDRGQPCVAPGMTLSAVRERHKNEVFRGGDKGTERRHRWPPGLLLGR
jgi:hypothetical protein